MLPPRSPKESRVRQMGLLKVSTAPISTENPQNGVPSISLGARMVD